MRKVLLLFTTLAVTATLFAAPVVTSIEPNRGPDTGGTLVSILGSGLATNVVCLLPCPTTVTFDDITVEAETVSDRELRVTTPSHAPGVVDVAVTLPTEPEVVVEDGFTFVDGPEAAFERVLVPVWLKGTVPGAHGSQWRTDFWLRNNRQESVQIAPWNCPQGLVCPPVFPLTHNLTGGRSLRNLAEFSGEPRSNPSQILYISNPDTKDVSMSLRVSDISRGTLNAGTDIPVIREGELLTRSAHLFDVPTDNKVFRVLLRVYDVTDTTSLFRVHLSAQSEEKTPVLHTTTLTATTPQSGPFRTEAAYAELPISDLVHEGTWPALIRVSVEPLTPGSRYWAFVSMTNNDTQLVTLATPQ